MKKTLTCLPCAALLVALLLPAVALAEEPVAEISRKARERGALNLVGVRAELRLTTETKDGRKKEQQLTSTARRVEGRLRSLARFSQPPGVAVLTVEGAAGARNRWALARTGPRAAALGGSQRRRWRRCAPR
jgi:hypothetical protein